MALDSSAFARHIAISSQVLSKSATLIITLVLRPFCVITIGRCVRAVRAKQSLSVRRYSVKGTTSSSRRGRCIGFVFVRMAGSPLETERMVHYSVPHVKGACRSLCHASFGGGWGRFAAARSVLFIWNAKRWHGLCRFQKKVIKHSFLESVINRRLWEMVYGGMSKNMVILPNRC